MSAGKGEMRNTLHITQKSEEISGDFLASSGKTLVAALLFAGFRFLRRQQNQHLRII